MRTWTTSEWLLFPPAIDLGNTVLAAPAELDLLATEEQLGEWVEAERGRIEGVEAARGRLAQVRELRADVRALLYARAEGRPPPAGPRRRLNAISEAAPTFPTLSASGEMTTKSGARDRYGAFAAAVARSAIELSAADQGELSVCGAPSCGMLYLRSHPRQQWCSPACGNRARVARHAARRRRG
jgi:predicted RNA-binding Zn ribbon-like protein